MKIPSQSGFRSLLFFFFHFRWSIFLDFLFFRLWSKRWNKDKLFQTIFFSGPEKKVTNLYITIKTYYWNESSLNVRPFFPTKKQNEHKNCPFRNSKQLISIVFHTRSKNTLSTKSERERVWAPPVIQFLSILHCDSNKIYLWTKQT